jgi:hypothetical protein
LPRTNWNADQHLRYISRDVSHLYVLLYVMVVHIATAARLHWPNSTCTSITRSNTAHSAYPHPHQHRIKHGSPDARQRFQLRSFQEQTSRPSLLASRRTFARATSCEECWRSGCCWEPCWNTAHARERQPLASTDGNRAKDARQASAIALLILSLLSSRLVSTAVILPILVPMQLPMCTHMPAGGCSSSCCFTRNTTFCN